MNIQDLSLEKTYIIGVSGGPDSMALLNMAYNSGLRLVVAHVNYQKRPTADRDMNIVFDYCLNRNIIFEYRLVKQHQGNFQKWARDQRYELFQSLTHKYQAMGVLVAHHQDDLIETYLLQKQRKQVPLYWGINDQTVIDDLTIIRPLLDKSKSELIEYCRVNGIQYGDDESNASDTYTRNKIRHHIVDNLDDNEKEEILANIKQDNECLIKQQNLVKNTYTEVFNDYDKAKLSKIDSKIQTEVIRYYLLNNGIDARKFSPVYLLKIYKFLNTDQNRQININGKTLALTYGKPVIFDKKALSYHYLIDRLEYIETPFFAVSNNGESINGVTITEDDLPLTIRSWQPDDQIKLRFGHKKINRWFIDRKIPLNERFSWPIILNRNQEIILVPGIGCNVAHFSNNPNMFVLKL